MKSFIFWLGLLFLALLLAAGLSRPIIQDDLPKPTPWRVPAVVTQTPTAVDAPGWWEVLPTPIPLEASSTPKP